LQCPTLLFTLSSNIRHARNKLPGTNDQPFFSHSVSDEEKKFNKVDTWKVSHEKHRTEKAISDVTIFHKREREKEGEKGRKGEREREREAAFTTRHL